MLQEKLNGLRIEVDNRSVPFSSSSVVEITDIESGETFKSFYDYRSRIADVSTAKLLLYIQIGIIANQQVATSMLS